LYYNNIQKPIIQDDPTQNIMLFSLSISDRIQSLAVFFYFRISWRQNVGETLDRYPATS